MEWYHGTNNLSNILIEGLKSNYGRFGDAVYYTNNKKEAKSFGKDIIKLKNIDNYTIVNIYYPDLIEKYPDIAIEEEEGIPALRDYIVGELYADGVVIEYANGEMELCIYNSRKN